MSHRYLLGQHGIKKLSTGPPNTDYQRLVRQANILNLIKFFFIYRFIARVKQKNHSNEDMILALAGQFKQLSHEPEKFR